MMAESKGRPQDAVVGCYHGLVEFVMKIWVECADGD